jgi:hypothetical protein
MHPDSLIGVIVAIDHFARRVIVQTSSINKRNEVVIVSFYHMHEAVPRTFGTRVYLESRMDRETMYWMIIREATPSELAPVIPSGKRVPTPQDPLGDGSFRGPDESKHNEDVSDFHATLRGANIARQKLWDAGNKIDPAYRGNEMAGEMGEAVEAALDFFVQLAQLSIATGKTANLLKKVQRERNGMKGSRTSVEDVAAELADVVICADLVAMSLGIDLDAAVRDKFNATSRKLGFPTRISPYWFDAVKKR